MPNVQISDVELSSLDSEHLLGFHLDSPTAGMARDTHAIPFVGWVAGKDQRVVALELNGPGVNHLRLPVGIPRPDVADAYPDLLPAAQPTGFRAAISTLGLPSPFTFEVSGLLRDTGRVPLVRVSGTRSRLDIGPSKVRPILVTTLGRTGSTLVMKLLGLHPEIAAYPLWRTEPKVASYWADVMLALADPRSHLQPVTSAIRGPNWWLGEARQFDEDFDDPDLKRWLGDTQVSDIARFCRARIEAFYERLVDQDQMPPYFAEKCVPRDPSYADVLREMFPETREIILVRDFKDMLCSMLAYSRRMGAQLFGRELAETDEGFVRGNLAAQVRLITKGWKRRHDSAFLLRYEDLILDPERTLESMLGYLGIDAGGAAVEALTAGLSYGDSQTHGTSTSARESIGRWRNDLDPALAAACDEALAEAMQAFGYADSPALASPVDAQP